MALKSWHFFAQSRFISYQKSWTLVKILDIWHQIFCNVKNVFKFIRQNSFEIYQVLFFQSKALFPFICRLSHYILKVVHVFNVNSLLKSRLLLLLFTKIGHLTWELVLRIICFIRDEFRIISPRLTVETAMVKFMLLFRKTYLILYHFTLGKRINLDRVQFLWLASIFVRILNAPITLLFIVRVFSRSSCFFFWIS